MYQFCNFEKLFFSQKKTKKITQTSMLFEVIALVGYTFRPINLAIRCLQKLLVDFRASCR